MNKKTPAAGISRGGRRQKVGRGASCQVNQPVATQDTQVDCVHLTPWMYDSGDGEANGISEFFVSRASFACLK